MNFINGMLMGFPIGFLIALMWVKRDSKKRGESKGVTQDQNDKPLVASILINDKHYVVEKNEEWHGIRVKINISEEDHNHFNSWLGDPLDLRTLYITREYGEDRIENAFCNIVNIEEGYAMIGFEVIYYYV